MAWGFLSHICKCRLIKILNYLANTFTHIWVINFQIIGKCYATFVTQDIAIFFEFKNIFSTEFKHLCNRWPPCSASIDHPLKKDVLWIRGKQIRFLIRFKSKHLSILWWHPVCRITQKTNTILIDMYFTDKRRISLWNFFNFFLVIDFHKENGVSRADTSVRSCTQTHNTSLNWPFL